MNKQKKLNKVRSRRMNRVRARIFGTKEKPRLSIFRSNRWIYAQLIDDDSQKTVASASSLGEKSKAKGKKIDGAIMVGKLIAEKAKKAGTVSAVFDRGRYKYHGRIKAVVDSARESGLKI